MAVHPKARHSTDGARAGSTFDFEGFLARHGNVLLANARRNSANSTDADDAYQRALEVMLTKPPPTDSEDQLLAWMHTVVRNESLQIHRRKNHELNVAFDEGTESWLGDEAPVDEKLSDRAELMLGREALDRIRTDQMRCLLLRADGMGYPEIQKVTGFSYAKVNRLISEGRRAFRVQVGMIESGGECRRLFPVLSMIADGEAAFDARADADVHLKNCLACQATLREMRAAPKELALALPVGAAIEADRHGALSSIWDSITGTVQSVYERVFGHAGSTMSQGAEVITAKKIAAATAVVAALAGGGVAVEKAVDGDGAARPAIVNPRAGSGPLVDPIPPAQRSVAERRAKARAAAGRQEDSVDAAAADAVAAQDTGQPSRGTVDGRDTSAGSGDPADLPPAGAAPDAGTDVGDIAP